MNNICIFGAAGFIGTNLSLELTKDSNNCLKVVDKKKEYFSNYKSILNKNIKIIEDNLDADTNFDEILGGQDIVYHLVSSNSPTTSNMDFYNEIMPNINFSIKLFDSCIKNKIKKVIFISSGGTIYGKDAICPINEDCITNPITTYGLQKEMIEKLLYIYNYKYGLCYKVIRLANPYGSYQRPNGQLGVITSFVYNSLKKGEINVYGEGSVVRDFIYIDDAIKGIINIANSNANTSIYNLGSGHGTSINEVISILQKCLKQEIKVNYQLARKVDVPVNYLDIRRYESEFGKFHTISIEEGIQKMINFMKDNLFKKEIKS